MLHDTKSKPQELHQGIADQVESSQRLFADENALITYANLVFPKAIEYNLVEPSTNRYQFLHDPAIEFHKGLLYAAWYNCPEGEIVGESVIRYRTSDDGGNSWSQPKVMISDTDQTGVFYVPAQLLSYEDTLYAFVGKMTGHDLITTCSVLMLDENKNSWNMQEDICDLFLPNSQPCKMANGNWVMAGRVAGEYGEKPRIPAVAISSADNLAGKWRVVRLQEDRLELGASPETTVWVEAEQLIALTRNDTKPKAYVYTSHDFGESWKRQDNINFPAARTKLYAGKLSTGKRYVVFNCPIPESARCGKRAVLALAVTQPGKMLLDKIWKIRDFYTEDKSQGAHYPCAIEHNGELLIVYTKSLAIPRQCEMARIKLQNTDS